MVSNMKNKKNIPYKECTSKIQELITTEEFISLWQYKCTLERKQNRMNRRKNKKVEHK